MIPVVYRVRSVGGTIRGPGPARGRPAVPVVRRPGGGRLRRRLPRGRRRRRDTGRTRTCPRLYVAAEKDTLRQQLTGWLADGDIPVLVVRGFGSQSYADVVHDRVTADPRPAVLLVVVLPGAPTCGRTLRLIV
nr:hypothetical protein StreXyl84_80090 [Streptomyces sp. Xyl84]